MTRIKRGDYGRARGKKPHGSGTVTRKDLIRGYKTLKEHGDPDNYVSWWREKDKSPYKVYVS